MKTFKSFFITALAIAFLASCNNSNCISGSGGYTLRDYNTASFKSVAVAGEADVFIVKDSTQSLRIEGQSNILNALNVKVNGQELSIGEDNCFRNASRLKIYIGTPTLTGLITSGSVYAISTDTFTENEFSAILLGTGSMELNLNVQEFNASVSGDGDIRASGMANEQYLSSSGNGFFKCFDLVGEDVDIDVSGTATMEVHATQTLHIDVSGTGFIYYKGNPSITQNISGTASIVDSN
jgi:hypothetical protein